MDRSDELRRHETLLRDTVRSLHRGHDLALGSRRIRERIGSLLAETQAAFDRHLADTPSDAREAELSRLSIEMPVFHYLKQWYEDGLSAGADDPKVVGPQ